MRSTLDDPPIQSCETSVVMPGSDFDHGSRTAEPMSYPASVTVRSGLLQGPPKAERRRNQWQIDGGYGDMSGASTKYWDFPTSVVSSPAMPVYYLRLIGCRAAVLSSC